MKKRLTVKGKGKWRAWTAEAILRSANANGTTSTRESGPDGSGPAGAMCARAINALAITNGSKQCVQGIIDRSADARHRFYITNTMFDETKLPMGKPRKMRRCLAWHSQTTWAELEGPVQDLDIPRPPQLLSSYTAATQWSVIARPTDPAGLSPCAASRPRARYYAWLTVSDSHAVNKLTSKFRNASLEEQNHFHAAAFCTQHKTGSICEEVGEQIGLLPPSFSLACQLQHADFYQDISNAVGTVLDKYMVCTDTPEVRAAAAADTFASHLLHICHECHCSTNEEEDDHEVRVGEEKRRRECQKFLEFFPPPWTGELIHLEVGCCATREIVVQKGKDLIMTVIVPHLGLPAANRYTRVFPVILRIALMQHFYSLVKKAFRLVLRSNIGDSDDEVELQSLFFGDTGPGTLRKLQAHTV